MAGKLSLTKGKSIFIVDLILIPVFILLIYSGLKLHIAGHTEDHEIWSYWANYHVIASIISIITGGLHIKAHWNWYKSLMKKGLGKKSKITLFLSLLFFVLVLTGIILVFFVSGPNSFTGLWHYRLGLVMTVLFIIHLITRLPLLMKGLGRKKNKKQV